MEIAILAYRKLFRNKISTLWKTRFVSNIIYTHIAVVGVAIFIFTVYCRLLAYRRG